MNSLQDPNKKTSITSLLNPDVATGYPHNRAIATHSIPHGMHQRPALTAQGTTLAHSTPPYSERTSFRLTSASWSGGVTHSDVHHHSGGNGYSSDRRDDSGYASVVSTVVVDQGTSQYNPHGRHRATSIHSMTGLEPGHAWQPSPEASSSGVSRPVIANGLEPTSQSSDLGTVHSEASALTPPAPKTQRVAGYHSTGTGQPHAAEWQTSERASLRLAARGSVPPTAQANIQHQPYLVPGAGYPVMVTYGVQLQVQQAPTQPSTASKRQLPDSEASTPKAKRPAKAKSKVGADGSPAPSKRGFNTKKRNEAAQIAAQNGSDRTSDSNGDGTVIVQQGHHVFETQFARCMSNRYRNDDFPRCVSCTRRWAGDTCRFQGIRCFLKSTRENNIIVGMRFNSAKPSDVPELHFPKTWNIPLQQQHIDRCKKVIAKALLSTLRSEREHLGLPDLIRRARESDVRVTCDTCMTSIFSTSWMCRLCGREACADCFAQVRELTEDAPGATPAQVAERQKRREKYAHSNPFFLSCTKRNEHQADCFSPMSRFFAEELDDAIRDMERALVLEDSAPETHSHHAAETSGVAGPSSRTEPVSATIKQLPAGDGPPDWSVVFKAKAIRRADFHPSLMPNGSAGESYVPPHMVEAAAITPYYDICRYTDDEVSDSEKFAKIWSHGEPVVVCGILDKFSINWSPEYFIQEFGDRECLITECEQDSNKKTTIKEFFGQFGKYEGRQGAVWKLKDWPPSADFKTAFPKLYKDFSEAVPVPDYVRRDGVCNIGSHFPSNVVAPDLGPKMYNAWAANQNPGCKGSTRLHMDMADAMNVMLYASPCPDGSPGCAVWDVYRAEDSDKIRMFLRKKNNLAPHYDPIHGQQYYLDDLLRAQLYKEYAVASYRVYQRPGEAIFVPAGCAHQVSNLADSIKIATDYVSPENIDRCIKLTQEFREQNKSKVWKEDILQLKTMMWFAWQSCSRQEKIAVNTENQDQLTFDTSSYAASGSAAPPSRRRADTSSSQSNTGQ